MPNLHQAAATRAVVPSFVDLRQFARDPSLGVRAGGPADDDRFLSSRRLLDWASGPVSAGAIALDAGQGAVASLPADEFVIVDAGSVTLTQQERTLTLHAGQSAMLQQGAAFAWSAQVPASLIFMRYNGSRPGDRAIVPVTQQPQLQASGTPPADLLITPAPVCRNHTDYRSADGEFTCGTWDSTPYARRAMFYRHIELMYLLEGSVTMLDATGRSRTFSQGDIFLVEQGAQCTWDSQVQVAKVYVIYRPA